MSRGIAALVSLIGSKPSVNETRLFPRVSEAEGFMLMPAGLLCIRGSMVVSAGECRVTFARRGPPHESSKTVMIVGSNKAGMPLRRGLSKEIRYVERTTSATGARDFVAIPRADASITG
jgi:hypothetical protein